MGIIKGRKRKIIVQLLDENTLVERYEWSAHVFDGNYAFLQWKVELMLQKQKLKG